MSIKKSALAVLAAAFAFAVLPAVASATPKVMYSGNGHFTIDPDPSGAMPLLALPELGLAMTCETTGGTGTFSSETTGTVQFTFHGCGDSIFESTCQSPGQPSGTIVTTELTFHTVTLTPGTNTPGVLITPNADGVFAHFECPALGLGEITVDGDGILGHVNAAYNQSIGEATVHFGVSGGHQQYTEYDDSTGSHTVNGLTETIGGESYAMSVEVDWIMTFENPVELT